MMEDRTSLIRVVNDNPFTIEGMFNGKGYKFKTGIPVDIPEVVAWHIFDFGKADKTQCLTRMGWARTSEDMASAMKKLDKVRFEDPPEMIEAPPKPKKLKRATSEETTAAGPPVDDSGTEGGVLMKAPPDGPRIGEVESAVGDLAQPTF